MVHLIQQICKNECDLGHSQNMFIIDEYAVDGDDVVGVNTFELPLTRSAL